MIIIVDIFLKIVDVKNFTGYTALDFVGLSLSYMDTFKKSVLFSHPIRPITENC